MDLSYKNALFYHILEYEKIESVWMEQLDLSKLRQQLFQQQQVWNQSNNCSRNVIKLKIQIIDVSDVV